MKITLIVSALGMGLLSTPAWSQVDANVALTSDYRFRGVSLSEEDLAIQGGLDWASEGGAYLGAWASNIAPIGDAEVELDLYGGISREFDGFSLDVGVIAYLYPGEPDTAYGEVYASLGTDTGIVASSFTVAYAPEQDNIGGEDNLYLRYDAETPIGESGLTLHGGLGYETGAFGDLDGDGDDKIDWSLGIGGTVAGIDWDISYIDTSEDGPFSDATAVLTVGKSF